MARYALNPKIRRKFLGVRMLGRNVNFGGAKVVVPIAGNKNMPPHEKVYEAVTQADFEWFRKNRDTKGKVVVIIEDDVKMTNDEEE